ncbi:MAG TPA: hypothetical protein VF242_08645 [Nitrososphaeraceae archaeon]
MSSKQTFNDEISIKNKKKKKKYSRKQDNNKVEEQQLQKKKSIDHIFYGSDKKQQIDIQTADNDDDNSSKQEQAKNTRDAKEIANYSLHLHKDMINTYNSIYSQLLQDISNSANDNFIISKRYLDYQFDKKNTYTNSIDSSGCSNKSDESLKLIDNIMTKNIDTFIKSIEITQKYYKDIFQSYLNCIKK